MKVPSFVAEMWRKAPTGDNELGRVRFSFDPLAPKEPPEFMIQLAGAEAAGVPKEYSLNFTSDMLNMHVFSETPQGTVSVDGRVDRKFDMKPVGGEEYWKLCRERHDRSMTRLRQIQWTEKRNILPVPGAGLDKKLGRVKLGSTEGKRIRQDRNDLEDVVFKLFDEQSFWPLKQLVQKTQQPVAFLKEVLNDLCIYNKRGQHQGMYEMKPEYKKHKSAEEQVDEVAGLGMT
ncbi:hypothetical protein CBR_g31689 [Chara braunii]|uniref:Uncharacterized protein n=1 Tax=Chara braunii TaxID=69332 RepID=A0A388JXZ5_CHABU|nr:hypothetical protein CBR_g31689 [Chara braunii]|eukprot:GBG62670.1 hypothetical protein CBR_g31689 [Chara braunii]